MRKPERRGPIPQGDILDITYPTKLSENILDSLKARKERTGVPVATQIRRAVETILEMPEDFDGSSTFASNPSRDTQIPVIGSSICGPLSEAITDTHEIRWISEDMKRYLRVTDDAIFVQATGDSMKCAGILDGDLVLMTPLAPNARPKNGEIALVQILTDDGGCDSTIKFWWMKSGDVQLLDGEGNEVEIPENAVKIEPVAVALARIGTI